MLETPQERVKLLKSGISGRAIEELYVKYNNFKIINAPQFFELVEINSNSVSCEAIAEYVIA